MSDFYTYTPTTDDTVDRAAAISKDFQTMEAQLALGSEGDGRNRARSIYQLGAYCQSYARLDLTAPLAKDVPVGAQVMGSASQGSGAIAGATRTAAQKGDTVLQVLYRLNHGVAASQSVTHLCSVGGNPTPQLGQCKYAERMVDDFKNTPRLTHFLCRFRIHWTSDCEAAWFN